MVSGSVDNNQSGYLTAEQIVLSTTPAGSSYSWGITRPSGSSVGRSALSETDVASPTFTPDVAGYYVISCNVDGTDYVLRINVTSLAVASPIQALRLSPITDAQAETPVTGLMLFSGSDHNDVLCVKDSAGDVFTIDVTAV